MDLRQTQQYANYLSKIGWEVERVAGINYFIKKILVASVLKLQRPEEIRISKIRELANRYRAFQIIFEPKNELDKKYLLSVGFRLSKSPFLPSKTLQIDLTRPKEKIFQDFKKDARAAVKKGGGLIVQSNQDLRKFREAWKKAVGMKRYVPPLSHLISLKKSFKTSAFFLTTQGGSSGAIFLLGDAIAYYWQAFTSKKGRENLEQYKIVWEGMLWAKKMGGKIFDFEGIYDERFPDKRWLGFSHFKKSFGGYVVEYPETLVKTRFPF